LIIISDFRPIQWGIIELINFRSLIFKVISIFTAESVSGRYKYLVNQVSDFY